MLKDFYNEIIPPWDSRYGKIGHARKYIGTKGYINKLGSKSYRYFIHPNLVLHNYNYDTGKTKISTELYCEECNWIDSRRFKGLIIDSTGLTDEEYYLLVVIKSNNKYDYKRCAYCRSRLPFTNLLRNYCSSGRMPDDYLGPITCSQLCLMRYKHNHPEIYGVNGLDDWRTNALTKKSWFINNASGNEAYFYIAKCDGMFKYGITSDPDQRDHRFHTYGEMEESNHIKIILKSSVELIAELEYLIKLELQVNEEYLQFKGLMQEFRIAFFNSYNKLFNA